MVDGTRQARSDLGPLNGIRPLRPFSQDVGRPPSSPVLESAIPAHRINRTRPSIADVWRSNSRRHPTMRGVQHWRGGDLVLWEIACGVGAPRTSSHSSQPQYLPHSLFSQPSRTASNFSCRWSPRSVHSPPTPSLLDNRLRIQPEFNVEDRSHKSTLQAPFLRDPHHKTPTGVPYRRRGQSSRPQPPATAGEARLPSPLPRQREPDVFAATAP